LAVQPLGINWPEGRLVAYGRSAAAVRPGDRLCIALSWDTGVAAGNTPPQIRLELVGPQEQIGGRYAGPASTEWGLGITASGVVALSVDRRAASGPYLINLSLLDDDNLPVWTLTRRTVVTVGMVQIDPTAPPQAGTIDSADLRGLQFRGRLSEWPFWPRQNTTSEGDL
jgi:hypothetical protein